MANLVALGEAFGQVLTPMQLQIYARELEDIGPLMRAVAFRRACRELKYFPKIAELRSLAGDGAEGAEEAVDCAWLWITRHIARHGVDRKTLYHFSDPEKTALGVAACGREMEEREMRFVIDYEVHRKVRYHLRNYPESGMHDTDVPTQFAYAAIPAPPIPSAIEYALLQLAFDLHAALERVKDADGFTRKEFAEAYKRGLMIERREAAAQLALGSRCRSCRS